MAISQWMWKSFAAFSFVSLLFVPLGFFSSNTLLGVVSLLAAVAFAVVAFYVGRLPRKPEEMRLTEEEVRKAGRFTIIYLLCISTLMLVGGVSIAFGGSYESTLPLFYAAALGLVVTVTNIVRSVKGTQ